MMEKIDHKKKLTEQSDEELMLLYLKNDQLAFNELFNRYQSRIYAFVLKRNNQHGDVKDILQNIFLKLHHSRHLYQSKFLFSAWIFCISRSVLFDYFRKINREQKKINKLELHEHSEFINQQNEVRNDVVIDLNSLPASQKKIIEYRYHQELSFEEIGLLIDKKPENVRQIISRGLRFLKKNSPEVKNGK